MRLPSLTWVAVAAAVALAALAVAAVASVPFRGHASSYTRVSTAGEVTVEGTAGRRGVVRARYVLPATWRRDSTLNARGLRFDTHNSCGHKVVLTPRLVQAADQAATERAAELAPASAQYVRAHGTRESAAFRVVRARGSKDLLGVLVQPLSRRFTTGTPDGQRVFAEIRAVATADPRTECHAGGPRRVGDAIGDAFGAGQAGGFALSSGSSASRR